MVVPHSPKDTLVRHLCGLYRYRFWWIGQKDQIGLFLKIRGPNWTQKQNWNSEIKKKKESNILYDGNNDNGNNNNGMLTLAVLMEWLAIVVW